MGIFQPGTDIYTEDSTGTPINPATKEKQDAIITAINTISGKATALYSYQAKSVDDTYTYYFFEDASLNWYIMRKVTATGVFDYAKGTGGYSSVFVDATSAPTGTPTFGSYGTIF